MERNPPQSYHYGGLWSDMRAHHADTAMAGKLIELGLNTPPRCAWILNFLTARPKVVRVGRHTSKPLTLNTGSPQGCVFSLLLYCLYTHDVMTSHDVWPGSAPTPSSSLRMTQWWWA